VRGWRSGGRFGDREHYIIIIVMYSLQQRHTLRRAHVKRPPTRPSVYIYSAPPTTTPPPQAPPPPPPLPQRPGSDKTSARGGVGAQVSGLSVADRVSVAKDLTLVAVRTDYIYTHTPMRVYLSVQEERKVAVAVDCVAGATDLGCGARCGPDHARLLLRARDDASLSRERPRKCPPDPRAWRSSGNRIFAPSAAAEYLYLMVPP